MLTRQQGHIHTHTRTQRQIRYQNKTHWATTHIVYAPLLTAEAEVTELKRIKRPNRFSSFGQVLPPFNHCCCHLGCVRLATNTPFL